MSVCGLGVDLCHMPRIAQAMSRHGPRFLKRIYCPEEIEEYESRVARQLRPLEFLASRWAVKEAMYKATYPELVSWKDTRVHVVNGRPEIVGSARLQAAMQARGANRALVSISHDGEYAMAQVLLLG